MDPQIINLTSYDLEVESKTGTATIPFSDRYFLYDSGRCEMYGLVEGSSAILEDARKTLVVTEDVGLWLSKPENANECKGRVVGPPGIYSKFVPSVNGCFVTTTTVKVKDTWVCYKDAAPPLKEYIYKPTSSESCSIL